MKTLLYYLLLFSFMWALTGCSSSWKVRRAKKLLESSGVSWQVDTVFSETKVFIPESKVDSVVKIVHWTDTITVHHDRVTTRVVVNPEKRIVYIASKCDPVTIIKKIPVTVSREIKVGDSRFKNFKDYAFGALIGAFLMFVFFIVARAAKWMV